MSRKKIRWIDTRPETKKAKKRKTETIVIDLKEIERLASLGMRQKDIAVLKGLSPEYISRVKKQKPEIDQAIRTGKKKDLERLLSDLDEFIDKAKTEDEKIRFQALKYKLAIIHEISETFKLGGEIKHEFDSIEIEIVKGKRKRPKE